MRYVVSTFRDAGLEAKWTRTRNGAPIIACRDPNGHGKHQRQKWWVVDQAMWDNMERMGIREGFDSCTMLGGMFFVAA